MKIPRCLDIVTGGSECTGESGRAAMRLIQGIVDSLSHSIARRPWTVLIWFEGSKKYILQVVER